MGGRTYPVRYYPIAIRLRTRKGCAILCIALNPQSGDSSGAILGVRSVALLHVIDSGKIRGLGELGERDGSSYAQSARNLNKSLTLPTFLKGRLT